MKIRLTVLLMAMCLSYDLVALSESQPTEEERGYATWSGLGPDKWATIWLIERYILPGTRVRLIPYNSRPTQYHLFDIPGSAYYRTTEETTFLQLLNHSDLQNSNLKMIASIIHDIEINMWLPDSEVESRDVEIAYRALQEHYGRNRVPRQCYFQFFDQIFASLKSGAGSAFLVDLAAIKSKCGLIARNDFNDSIGAVKQIPIGQLLAAMRAGSKVAFVDVREPQEFDEVRIPGAQNVPIRDLNPSTVLSLATADIVVSYCVKDFRAFEMAYKLRLRGLENVVILNPFGLKGWLDAGLPVVRSELVSEAVAAKALEACLDRAPECELKL